MNNVNYIHHLNAVFAEFSKDERLNPSHISLYMALFYYWNLSRFADKFYIDRAEVMHFARLGSKMTYHKNLHNLEDWKYLKYYPSFNPYKGSQIHLYNFGTSRKQLNDYNHTKIETSSGQALVRYHTNIETGSGQAVGRNTNIYKHININKLGQPKNLKEVFNFFNKNNWPKIEAEKFFNHYQGIGWKVGGRTKIVDWQATAHNWMIKAEELKKRKTAKAPVQNWDNLHTNNDKNYDEPL